MNVSLDKEIAEELITFKLRRIQELIRSILNHWNESTSESFINKRIKPKEFSLWNLT